MNVQIDVANLQMGMYVTELDRPWSDTNFMFQGFLIESEAQLNELKAQCSYVIVSQEKSLDGLFELEENKPSEKKNTIKKTTAAIQEIEEFDDQPSPIKKGGLFSSIKQIGKDLIKFKSNKQQNLSNSYTIQFEEEQKEAEDKRKQVVNVIRKTYSAKDGSTTVIADYPVKTTLEEELKSAKKASESLNKQIADSFMLEMTSADLSDRIDIAKDILNDVVDSIIRNPNAMLLINSMKSVDDLTYRHAMDMSIMMVSFGRQLGIPKKELNEIALGGLLHDIGKSKIDKSIIKKPQRLNAQEYAEAQKHVEYGLEIVKDIAGLGDVSKAIIELHHERYDGKGYPRHLSGEDIGLYGSMAGIVETYASMTANLPYAEARSSSKAVSVLVALRGKAFQSEMVDQFIQVVGVYPVGSIVQLNTGEVGIVIKQNKLWRLKPIITLVCDHNGNPIQRQRTVDLVRDVDPDTQAPLAISTELPAGSFNIDPKNFFL